MSDYTPSTNFAAKDALTSGNPAKIIKGTEISAEFTAIQTAVASKADASSSNSFVAGSTSVTSLSDAGNLTFTGTGARITGDFSNATVANRVMFQTSTVNGATAVAAIGNGTSGNSSLSAFTGSDPNNASIIGIRALGAGETRIDSSIVGTGTYLPMTFYTGGSERVKIDTSGNVGVGSAPTYDLDVIKTKVGAATVIRAFNSDTGATSSAQVQAVSGTVAMYMYGYGNATGNIGTESNHQVNIRQGAATRVILDTTGNTLHINAAGGLGYGTGAGGTVTQATSRTTAVTLNKPCGAITMFSAAGSATAATFVVNNSLVAATDVIVLTWRGASNVYQMIANSQAAGSFQITFFTTGGTAVDAPVIQFAIIKGVNA